MAGIYCADIYCDDCINEIKRRLIAEYTAEAKKEKRNKPKRTHREEKEYDYAMGLLGFDPNDESTYDSDDYPKYADDDEATDCPQHCGSGAECLNALTVKDKDGTEHKIGCLIGNSLTEEGAEYVKAAVLSGEGLCCELWRAEFDWIDYRRELTAEDKAALVTRLTAQIASTRTPVNAESAHDEFLDEQYSFECVGGLFANYSPARVMKAMSDTDYRCSLNDYIDGREDLIEVAGELYNETDVGAALDALADEIEPTCEASAEFVREYSFN